MSTHARYAPSSAHRTVACPGSVDVEMRYPDEPTIDKLEGEATHWAAAERLQGVVLQVGDVAPNGVILNVEMNDAAEMYAEHIIKRDIIFGIDPHVETPLPAGPVHPENYGTPDFWSYNWHSNHLHVDDLKYGHGFVSENRNYQLINYVALAAYAINSYHDDSLKVTMTIHQARNYHRRGPTRSWTTTLGELRRPIAELAMAYRLADGPDAPVMARDPDACRDCKGRHECEAAIMAEGPAIDLAYSSAPLVMSPQALSKEYRRLIAAEKMIKLRREGIEQHVMSTIERGGIVPCFSIERKKGRTVWLDGVSKDMIGIGEAYGVTVGGEPKLITPLQAIKAGIPEEVVKAYSYAQSGAVELVEDDGSAAARVFE